MDTDTGTQLMTRALADTRALWGEQAPLKIGAQAHLQHFYGRLGFTAVPDSAYDEDGIPHVEMVWTGSGGSSAP